MAESQNDESSQGSVEANFAQALNELSKGEQTAAALENHLTALERKIEELLARASEDEAIAEQQKQSRGGDAKTSSTGKGS